MSRLSYWVVVVSVMLGCVGTEALRAQFGYGYYNFGRNKIQYENFDWQVLQTEHFDIYYYSEMKDLADYGAYFAEEIYKELENRFELSLTHRVPLIFYASNLHFKQTNVTPGFIPDNVGGFFEFLKGRVVVPSNGNIHRFRRVIRHELVHVFTYVKVLNVMNTHRQATDRFLPLWFTEGLAEYWSGEPDYQHEMVIRDGVVSNYLVPLDNLYRISGSYLMYKQGEALFRFVSETYGEDKILRLLDNFWKDRDFRKVLEVTLREPFNQITRRWDGWLKSQYLPILEDSDLPSLLADGLSVRGFNAKPVFYQKADGTREVYYVGNESGYGNLYAVEVDSAYQPVEKPRELVQGERNKLFEAFHLMESRIDVSGDGRLAFVTKSGERDVIHVYDVEQDELLNTYDFGDLVAVYSPTWDASGTRLAFSSIDNTGFSDLYTFDTKSERLQRLTNDRYDDRDPAWSPDGDRLVFSSDRTSEGEDGAYNLFSYDLDSQDIGYVTFGAHQDFSPRWSPNGDYVVFTSTRRDSTGRFSAQNIWVADMRPPPPMQLASVGLVQDESDERPDDAGPVQHQLTRLTSAAFDPVWTEDDRLVFSTFEHFRFTIRQMGDVDSLVAKPRRTEVTRLARVGLPWRFKGIEEVAEVKRKEYKRNYSLDIAQGGVSQNPLWGTSGGAFVALSDMLGDDFFFFTLYNGARNQGEFLRSLSFQVSRLQLHRRANTGYGIYRHAGLRYDITDPDASAEFPIFWETLWGGYGAVSYPLSQFRRVEVSTSLNWSDKDIYLRDVRRKALLLSNALSLVHDNALYGFNGPIAGWRGNVLAAYTTDVLYSNVSYFTLSTDLRHYWRLNRYLTLASWGLARWNQGREARLFILGGSWDLRGYPLFRMRGRKQWFTSHELRFPILEQPGRYLPLLSILGIVNLRGALFFDAAHAWNDDYDRIDNRLLTGETLGSAGLGFRLNLFGGMILRYDIGYRHREGFSRWDDKPFRQFFFGWDF